MTTDRFASIGARVASAESLNADDLRELAATHDIVSLGMLADDVRRRRHGERTTFVRVADVAIDAASPAWPADAGEIRVSGTPASWSDALAVVERTLREAGGVPVTALSLADLEAIAADQGRSLTAILQEARASGLEWIAEAPIDRLRDPQASLTAVREAGLQLARATVALPQADGGIELFQQVRRLIDAGAGIRGFAPLPRTISSEPSTGYDDVKQVALARLTIDNVSSIQVDWALYGPKLAQVALTFGADDVDAVPAGEDRSLSRRRQPLEEIRRNIRASMQTPIERNGRFEPIGP